MKKIIIVVIAVIVLAVGAFTFTTGGATPEEGNSPRYVSVRRDVETGAKLYDVRTPEEFVVGHFEPAENWSLQDMEAGKFPEMNRNARVYVYCNSGNRSSQAEALLKDAGFTDVIDLGGLQDVQKIGGILIR